MIDNPDLLEYAIKGTDNQWNEALKNGDGKKTSNVQILSSHGKAPKRKLNQEDIEKEITGVKAPSKKKKGRKKKSSKA